MKNKFAMALLAVAVGGGLLFGTASAADKTKEKVVETKSQKSRGQGTDEHIKNPGEPVNKEAAGPQAPPNKGGDKTRGVYCQVHVDNRTPWWVKVFVDGNYAGVVGPWGDIYPTAISGRTQFYARADFDNGAVRYWGPYNFDCDDAYTWRILP